MDQRLGRDGRGGSGDLAWSNAALTAPRGRVAIGVVAALVFAAATVAIKPFVPPLGWAAFDAREYHFAVIDYFITERFDFGFPPVLAMFPGMHLLFAGVARLLGLGPLAFDGWAAFLMQSVVAALYLAALVRLWLETCAGRPGGTVLLLPLLCSSYPLYSWLWPTTDLGADACFVAMLLLALRPGLPGWGTACAFALLTVAAALFRQIYAPLGATLLVVSLLRLWTGAAKGRARNLLPTLMPTFLPLLAACAVLGMFLAIWGGLLPPELRRHESSGVQFVTVAHAVALTGLVAWPFALSLGRMLGRRDAIAVGGAGLVLAALACLVLPLDPNPGAGRGGSMVWTVAERLGPAALALAFVGVLLAIGFSIWLAALRLVWRERRAAPELVLIGLYLATFLVQSMSWQRYVEVQILVVLTVFVGRRSPPRGREALLFAAWFGAYAALSFAKPFLGFVGSA